ncbi:CBO0543 family protein [Aquibacillus kalidii]|uniref:CBO0543 family protein n=1 Tax=Aquibacillus kalidii TaxID=2762597 RepID=UPI001646C73A|nr:CBO0543 family protein [Aquibacillus kalidii]
MTQQEHFQHIQSIKADLDQSFSDYWRSYSDFQSWQFWVVLALFIIPLIVLFFKIDRSKIFLLVVYGYSIHVLAAYLDAFGMRKLWWDYPYVAFPQLPGSIGIDASFIPVYFMLMYQWCINKKKSYWIYATISCIGFTFIFKPLLLTINLFEMNTSWFLLLSAYLFGAFAAKIITEIFIKISGTRNSYK